MSTEALSNAPYNCSFAKLLGYCSFYYADERNADGSLKGMAIDGEAHADFYLELAKQESNIPWHATFVKDQSYVEFRS